MPRLFNVQVFDESISGDVNPPTYYSMPEHHALLGSADTLLAQVIVEGLTNSTVTVSVTYQISNTGNESEWSDSSKSTTVAPAGFTAAALPKIGWIAIDTTADLGAFGRFKVTADKNSITKVRIIVCGHSR